MRKPFEVGERVSFEWSQHYEPLTWRKGTVHEVKEYGRMIVRGDNGTTYNGVLPYACRRLRKKPKREWKGVWMQADDRKLLGHEKVFVPDHVELIKLGEEAVLREVRPTQGVKSGER